MNTRERLDSARREATVAREQFDVALLALAEALRAWLGEEGIIRRSLASRIPFTNDQGDWHGKIASLTCINGGLQFFDEDGDEVDVASLETSTLHAVLLSALAEREETEEISSPKTWTVEFSMKSSQSGDEMGRPTYRKITACTEERAIAEALSQARAAAVCTGWHEGEFYLELVSAKENIS